MLANGSGDFESEATLFLGYWSGLPRRGGSDLPSRCDFEPAAVLRLLPRISIVEARQEGLRVRLVGTELVARLGRDPTRRYLAEVGGGAYLDFLERLMRAVIERRRPIVSGTEYGADAWRKATLRRASVPLSTNGAEVDQVMTLAVCSWPAGAEPFPIYADDRDGPHRHRMTPADEVFAPNRRFGSEPPEAMRDMRRVRRL